MRRWWVGPVAGRDSAWPAGGALAGRAGRLGRTRHAVPGTPWQVGPVALVGWGARTGGCLSWDALVRWWVGRVVWCRAWVGTHGCVGMVARSRYPPDRPGPTPADTTRPTTRTRTMAPRR